MNRRTGFTPAEIDMLGLAICRLVLLMCAAGVIVAGVEG